MRASMLAAGVSEFRRFASEKRGKLKYGSASAGANSPLVDELMNARLETR
ncbi:hypothetical protein [Enterovirga aerilata]|uniref:Uncharacterized protein n=1 Tax=Enterovirga aerilata TaxID=2730920 RepID=A0A849IA00_9HYPH|nr:hypothetical protein [Enterovirga sp. DB1703]NNM74131.1 hypothetical protein [Enterovirga sp. DB1703]